MLKLQLATAAETPLCQRRQQDDCNGDDVCLGSCSLSTCFSLLSQWGCKILRGLPSSRLFCSSQPQGVPTVPSRKSSLQLTVPTEPPNHKVSLQCPAPDLLSVPQSTLCLCRAKVRSGPTRNPHRTQPWSVPVVPHLQGSLKISGPIVSA